MDALGSLFDFLTALWEEVLQPLLNWLAEKVNPVLAPIIHTIGTVLVGVIETFGLAVGTVFGAISGILDGLTEVIRTFGGDWEDIWGSAADPITKLRNTFRLVANSIITIVEGMVNGIVRALNRFSFTIDIPDNPISGAQHFTLGFNLSEISIPKIPYLANGAVLRGGNPFAAIVNDQPMGQTNIETPLETMVDAFRTALEDYQGGINTAILNVDGRELARVTLGDYIGEIQRRGVTPSVVFGGT